MHVRIFRPAKNAMQSGPRGNSAKWVLEHEPVAAKRADPLMGWLGSDDTTCQIRIKFDSRDQAVAFAERKGWSYEVAGEPKKPVKLKNYADNFRSDKLEFGRF